MKQARRSRLDEDGEKLLDVPAVKLARRRGGKVSDYTGADIFRTWPDGYRRAVEMLGEGATVSTVAEVLGLSRNTVAGIRDREAGSATLEQARQRSAAEFRGGAAIARDKARELLTDPKAKFRPRDLGALATAATMFEQQAEQLTGGAVVRVEHVHSVRPDDFDELIRASKRVPMDCGGEESGQAHEVREVAGGFVGVGSADRDGLDETGAKVQSDHISDDTTAIHTHCGTFGGLSPLAAPLPQGLDGPSGAMADGQTAGPTDDGHALADQPDRGGGGPRQREAGYPDIDLPAEFPQMPSGAQEKN